MTVFNRIPFLRILIFLVAGILIKNHTDPVFFFGQFLSALFLAFTSLLFIYYHFWHRLYTIRWIPGLCISFLLLLTGVILTQHQSPREPDTPIITQGVGTIITLEHRNHNRLRITLQPEAFQQPTSLRPRDKLLLMVQGPLDVLPHEGDQLFFKGTIHPLPRPTNPNAFDYGLYLQNNGFSGQTFLNSEDIVIQQSKRFDYRLIPNKIRNKCLTIFKESGVSEPALTIIQALLLGDRSAMDREIQDSFIKSGAIHLLAVSGLHVGILYMILSSFLSLFFKPSNAISLLLSLGFLLAYAFITGFSPSVSRAALMFAVIHIGRASNRNTNIYNSLAVSASLLLIINPLFIYHVGFWLSHLAVLGIVTFYPIINALFTFRFIVWRQLWSLIAVSLAAQITTLPLSLYTFGAFPTWFLLSNLLMLPLVAPILLLAIANLLFSFSPLLSTIFAGGLNDLLVFMSEMAVAIEQLPYGYLEYLWLSFPLVIISYIAIHQMGQLCYQRHGKYWIGLAAALLVLTVGLNIQYHHKLNSEQIVVYDTREGLLVDIIQRGHILTVESEAMAPRTKSYARNAYIKQYRRHRPTARILTLKNDTLPQVYEIALGSQRLLVFTGNQKEPLVPSKAYEANMVIIQGALNIDLQQLIEKTKCATIIAAATCPYPLVEKWRKETALFPVIFHAVREQGAFISPNKSNYPNR
ncbi:MAG: competence protein ComEC family protein [Bacteroidales bacterium]|nr:competence protein ComEC family protein [Bacteroidales bacterium]